MQRVLELYYQDANIGPFVDANLTYTTFKVNKRPFKPDFSSPKGWKVVHEKEVRKCNNFLTQRSNDFNCVPQKWKFSWPQYMYM